MTVAMGLLRRFKFAMALAAGLALAACASNPNPAAVGAAGAAAPGSQQDFVVNVGDRVFFESDSSELTIGRRSAR